MTYVRHYVMRAKPAEADALAAALVALRDAVRRLPGALDVTALRDREDAERFIFIERWTDQGAHHSAGPALPDDVMATVKAALGAPPEAGGLDELAD